MHKSDYGLADLGLNHPGQVHRNLSVAELVEAALHRGEGVLTAGGALRVATGKYTGRSPHDKFVVDRPALHDRIWWGNNAPFEPERFERLYRRLLAYLEQRELFIFDGFAGADPRYRLPIRVVNELAWQNLFAHQLFRRPTAEELKAHEPGFTIIAAPGFKADPALDGTNSEAFIVLDFERRLVLIGGTSYAGEIKKSVFTVMNYLLPLKGVLSMHCSANQGEDGDVALFFGLSGTGKTTLSADPQRFLIGDDEHGWSDEGIFNFEGGCYAKCIRLSQEHEPQIWGAIRFGTVLENVVLDPATRLPDYADDSLTENTRAAYPLDHIPGAVLSGTGGVPRTIIFLTADAFGVLPPIARLTREQAMYQFISGYTSKLAGTERGVTEPQATFSTCFGAPFLPLAPTVYAELLGRRIDRHGTDVYLVNTGWSGGSYGVGQRMNLAYTRAMVRAAVSGQLRDVPCTPDPIFKVLVPQSCPGVPAQVLRPQEAWEDKEAYARTARALAARFAANVEKFGTVPAAVLKAGPQA
ncbi:MAG TPA: phosphoenolpyruvate carboxykinase (ATP) [Firmicutes bacterium]|uniref:phosphoenolpyruvate carboxykinase (ATP) n=1 Tax=Gelria sp. Kuro-4 TaxID=2796927 RepID=UPI0019C285DB|nr:phosphoenolpyruvate carboxykinase (ATP) [Gelria sp. Kuro-4]BCV25398.1 phosphoenolpyruvate carboxykinase [ATP] 2 [Gelria sp. Kuro-4]HHV58498.1 phosphoenolpyruvate carboxykinase (ATP) [Bacillota bacterium]